MQRRRLTAKQKAEIREEQGEMCFLCHKPLEGRVDFDHILPLALGGRDDLENICAVHNDPCHKRKTRADVARIRKADRQRLYAETGRSSRRKTRRIQNRPFDRRWKKKLNGQVERRDG